MTADRIRAISLWQPWASLWLSTCKVHETRHWNTYYRGPLIVHAAKRLESNVGFELDQICQRQFGTNWRVDLPRGALLGILQLIDCVPTKHRVPVDHTDGICGDFGPGRYMWKRGAFHLWTKPEPWVGRQGFFSVPASVLEAAA